MYCKLLYLQYTFTPLTSQWMNGDSSESPWNCSSLLSLWQFVLNFVYFTIIFSDFFWFKVLMLILKVATRVHQERENVNLYHQLFLTKNHLIVTVTLRLRVWSLFYLIWNWHVSNCQRNCTLLLNVTAVFLYNI